MHFVYDIDVPGKPSARRQEDHLAIDIQHTINQQNKEEKTWQKVQEFRPVNQNL